MEPPLLHPLRRSQHSPDHTDGLGAGQETIPVSIFQGLTKISNYVKATPESTTDDSPPRTHIPVDGSVDLPLDNPVAALGPGELLGELTALAALKQDRVKRAKFYPRSATVQAKTDVEVLEILPHILNKVLMGYPLDSGSP